MSYDQVAQLRFELGPLEVEMREDLGFSLAYEQIGEKGHQIYF